MFVQQTGVTPARFVERLRIPAVRELLEDTLSMKQIPDRCGFAGPGLVDFGNPTLAMGLPRYYPLMSVDLLVEAARVGPFRGDAATD